MIQVQYKWVETFRAASHRELVNWVFVISIERSGMRDGVRAENEKDLFWFTQQKQCLPSMANILNYTCDKTEEIHESFYLPLCYKILIEGQNIITSKYAIQVRVIDVQYIIKGLVELIIIQTIKTHPADIAHTQISNVFCDIDIHRSRSLMTNKKQGLYCMSFAPKIKMLSDLQWST